MVTIPTLQRWLVVQAVLWLAALGYIAVSTAGTSLTTSAGLPTTPMAFLCGGAMCSWVLLWVLLGTGRTVADWVTLGRFFALLGAAAWALLGTGITWPIWTLLLLAVCADLLDGWCARRWGGSEAGAILDMETDQLVTLLLALLAFGLAAAPLWLLLLPALRYAYVLYVTLLGLPAQDPKPRGEESKRGKRICALTLTMLLVCVLPIASSYVQLGAGLVALAALLYSFGSDAVYLAQQRLRMRTSR